MPQIWLGYRRRAIDFTRMQEWSDECRVTYSDPHQFFEFNRLALADFYFDTVGHLNLERVVEVAIDVLDKMDVDQILPIGAKKMGLW